MLGKEETSHYLWDLYSKDMLKKIMNPLYAGKKEGDFFSDDRLGIRYLIQMKYKEEEKKISFFSYRVFGPTFMVAILETLGQLVEGKSVTRMNITAEELLEGMKVYEPSIIYGDKELKGYIHMIAPYLNHVLESYFEIAEKIIPINYTTPEGLKNVASNGSGVKDFKQLSKEMQLSHIEKIMEEDIAPFVALDGGGVKVKDITKSLVVMIEYEGNCTSCYSASSTTLSAIISILKGKVHSEIEVLPVIG